MSNRPPDPDHDPPSPSSNKPVQKDDSSEVTLPQGKTSNENKQEMMSKVLKFSFVFTASTKHTVAPSVIHTHWMQIVQESLEDDIIIINNHNKQVDKVNTLTWADPKIHQKQFKLYEKSVGYGDKRNTTYFILHRIQTNVSVGKIKQIPNMRKLMKEYNFFISDHQWTETEWDTTRIGFATNIDPSFYNRTQAHQKFHDLISSKAALKPGKKVKIPQFRTSFSSPQVRHESLIVSTKAYAIEVKSEDAAAMMEVMSTVFRDTPHFVAYNLKRKFPAGYEKAIRYQSHLLQSTMVVVVQNISSDMMFYLQEHIMSVSGIREILATPKANDSGRYSLLVDKALFEPIRKALMKHLPKWIDEHVQQDALPTEDQFPGPARVKPLFNDGLSSGENSWMTQSNASFMSIDLPPEQEKDFFKASMNANRVFTFDQFPTAADAVSIHSGITTDDVSKAPPPTSVKVSAWTTAATSELTENEIQQQKEIARLIAERDLATEQANKIIEEQRAEIEVLKKQQLQEKTERDKAMEDIKSAQAEATMKLKEDLRIEMKVMMEQFMLTLLPSELNQTGTKRPVETTPAKNDNSLSEKRRDDRPTPERLFTSDKSLRDSTQKTTDAMDADVLPTDSDHD